MKVFAPRIIVFSIMAATFLSPLYAHHGAQFLSGAMEMNTATVRFAEIAPKKTENASIREFAKMLARDHNQILDRIKQLRDARLADSISANGRITGDAAKIATAGVHMTPAHQRIFERLATLSGDAFDRDFMDVMVQEHRQAIRDFEAHSHAHGNAITGGKKQGAPSDQTARQKPVAPDHKTYSREELRLDVDTAEFAAATLPILRRHLEQAEEILKDLPSK